MTGLVAFFRALPQIVSLLSRIGSFIESKRESAWLTDLEDALGKAEKAQSTEERINAARSLVSVIRKL